MSINRVTLEHVNAAHQARDASLVELFVQLVSQPADPDKPKPAQGAVTFQTFLKETQHKKFFRQPLNDQASQRIEKLKQLEVPEVAKSLEPKYHSHQLLVQLYESGEEFDRRCLLEIIRKVPLVFGPWKGLKQIFKASEQAHDTEVFGALAARFDHATCVGGHGIRRRTLDYLVRRAWRYLRRLGDCFPAMYAEAAVDVLVEYPDGAMLHECWLINHILHHQTEQYKRTRFQMRYWKWDADWLRHRAFPEAWKRSPLPLFTLLANAKRNDLKEYAVSALKLNFKNTIREIEPSWVRQLVGQNDAVADQFVVWILKNVPRFEQSAFRELELHEAVLRLLHSPASDARKFACGYVRTHARDLTVDQLIELANHHDEQVRKLATEMLATHDPREDVGLEAWGQLLETKHGHSVAVESLRKHFGASELTPDWFRSRLIGGSRQAADFAADRLTEVHDRKSLGIEYFYGLIRDGDPYDDQPTLRYAINEIGQFDLAEVDGAMLEQLFLSTVWMEVFQLVNQGKLAANQFDAEFLKAISFHPGFDNCSQVKTAKENAIRPEFIRYDESRAGFVFGWLSDIRTFRPDQIGFEWLMELVQRTEPRYHDFATDLMSRAFLPADFATTENAEPEAASTSDVEINIDFEKATFVFTGKLATMTRAEAQKKVTDANGKNSGTVSKNLDYLVIGDEGSPMYGQGRKGSKQLKAESLTAEGHDVRVISETAFLQMLSGTQREFSEDAVEEGCQRLWDMLLDNPAESPLGRFALAYLRQHHKDICLAETDRPVDPGAEIPDGFLTFDRVQSLLTDTRKPLRDFGLKLSEYEFARWSPSLDSLVELCETPHPEVRKFVSEALLAEDTPQSRRWRLDPESFDAESVYQFCQSRDAETRAIGMKLIDRYPRLRKPEKLFMLAESPDRNVRAFVIRAFWSLYRDRFTAESWKPSEPTNVKRDGRKKEDPDAAPRFGVGAPDRPDNMPAAIESMQYFLRRILFEISPGPPPRSRGEQIGELKIKPLATRRGKVFIIEAVRDIAIEDLDFARAVHPVLVEFMDSHGMTEHDTCLVAVARIEKAHPDLASALVSEEEVAK